MVDNFEQITKLLTFDSSDDFYYCNIIKRRKENPNLKTNHSDIKSYIITSTDYLESKKDEIKNLCKFNNARAYINVNKKSFEKCAYNSMKKLSDLLLAKSYKSVSRLFDSVVASTQSSEKIWLIDIDDMDFPSPLMMAHIEHGCKPYGDKIIGVIKTVNGCHLLTKPFNVNQFRGKYPEVDLKKNSPTLLFY